MKASRSTYDSGENPISFWVRFWFTPSNPLGLHVIRMLTGVLLLAWLLPLAGSLDSLFGMQGWFDEQAYKEAASMGITPKPIGWSLLFVFGTSAQNLALFYWASVAIIVLFTVGIASRVTAVLTWLIVASFTSNPAMEFDADPLFLMLTFYLMIAYVLFGQRRQFQTWFYRLLGGRDTWLLGQKTGDETSPRPSLAANLAIRLLQVHMAVIILTSGLHKLQFGEWWAGFAYWYALYPPLETDVRAAQMYAGIADMYFFVLSAAAYMALAWQIGFPLYAWRPRWWRAVLFGGAFIGILGSVFLYRIPLFGQAIFIGGLGFLTPEEWNLLFSWLPRIPGFHWLEGKLPLEDDDDEPPTRQESTEFMAAVGHR